MAVKERNVDLVRFLLAENVDPSPRMRKDGQTPLHMAVNERKNIRVIELLVVFGADVNARYVSEFESSIIKHPMLAMTLQDIAGSPATHCI